MSQKQLSMVICLTLLLIFYEIISCESFRLPVSHHHLMIRDDKYFTTRPHGGIIQQSNNNSIVTRFPARAYMTLPLSKPDDADIHIQKIANHNKDNNDLITQSSSYNYNHDETITDTPPNDDDNNAVSAYSISTIQNNLGEFEPSKKIPIKREVLVGDPQRKLIKEKEWSVTAILKELAAIQAQGPQKYCILGTRHCSFLHQQIVELLSYALVLSENHVYTSGAMGTNAAAIRGALRAGRPDLLTVILPQSLSKQSRESQELLRDVTDLITLPQNDDLSLDVASSICNSKLLSETDQLIAFAFHESTTVIEATKEAKKLDMLVTTLYLD